MRNLGRRVRAPPPPENGAAAAKSHNNWQHMGMDTLKIRPHVDEWPMRDLARRTIFTYRWRWEPGAQKNPNGRTMFGPITVSHISLHDLVNEPVDGWRGMHVCAMHDFYISLATAPVMPQAQREATFGTYDPWQHKGPGE
jgi:hypothetical protein